MAEVVDPNVAPAGTGATAASGGSGGAPPTQEMVSQPVKGEAADDADVQTGLLDDDERRAQQSAVVAPFWEGVTVLPPVADIVEDEKDHYYLQGSDFSQILQVRVRPGEVITTEPGAMVLMSDGLAPSVDTGGCGQGCKRCCCAGENFFRLALTNHTNETQFLGLSPIGPGKVIPIDLRKYSGLTFNRGAFLAAVGKDWHIKIKTVSSVTTGCCGGQGFFLNELHGNNLAFLHGIGCIEQLELQAGQKYIVDSDCVLAFEKTVNYSVRGYGCSLVCCCGGFGLFQAELTGPGLVLVQSLPIEKLRRAIAPAGGGGGGGGGGDGGGGGN